MKKEKGDFFFFFFICIWTTGAIHMLRGLNVHAYCFWQKGQMAEKAQQYEKGGERKK